jgi:hypothetical protein
MCSARSANLGLEDVVLRREQHPLVAVRLATWSALPRAASVNILSVKGYATTLTARPVYHR